MSKPKTAVEAARRVRADIKRAAGNGSLGDLPPGIKFSVTAPRMGLARPVVISVQDAPPEWAFGRVRRSRLSPAATDLAWALRDILGSHWTGRVDVDGVIVCGI